MESSGNVTGVIVADDNSMMRGLLRSALQTTGQSVFIASNGLEAVDLASRMQPTLIMLDLDMPQMGGLEACQRIRQQPHNVNTPIVILTLTKSKDAEDAAMGAGATAFLTKPFRPAHLLQVLSRFMPGNHTPSASDKAAGKSTGNAAPDSRDVGKDVLGVLHS